MSYSVGAQNVTPIEAYDKLFDAFQNSYPEADTVVRRQFDGTRYFAEDWGSELQPLGDDKDVFINVTVAGHANQGKNDPTLSYVNVSITQVKKPSDEEESTEPQPSAEATPHVGAEAGVV